MYVICQNGIVEEMRLLIDYKQDTNRMCYVYRNIPNKSSAIKYICTKIGQNQNRITADAKMFLYLQLNSPVIFLVYGAMVSVLVVGLYHGLGWLTSALKFSWLQADYAESEKGSKHTKR